MELIEVGERQKSGSNLQAPARHGAYLKVKPENKLFFQTKQKNKAPGDTNKLIKTTQIQQRSKHGFQNGGQIYDDKKTKTSENDFYKSWMEQNDELEVSMLSSSQIKKHKMDTKKQKWEVELIPLFKLKSEKKILPKIVEKEILPKIEEKEILPKIEEKAIGGTILKSDLDQFLEGKEISSSGIYRKDLESVMLGRFNPNRGYSNEAMWAALKDVKKGASIYRASQTHKVPTKSLRNWMKLCHIQSSSPMPQPLKQFVEKSKKNRECSITIPQKLKQFVENFQKQRETAISMSKPEKTTEYGCTVESQSEEAQVYDNVDFGNHFLFSGYNILDDDMNAAEINQEPND